MKKLRIVSVLLALAMCLAIAVPAASAAESTTVRLYDEHKTSKIQVKEGEPFGSALPAPSKSGKVFLGWYANRDAENFVLGDYVDSSTVYDESKHGTALYAMWSYGTDYLTVNLDPQGGIVQPATAKAYSFYHAYNPEHPSYGVIFEELPTPVRPGYKFTGWSEDNYGLSSLYSSHSVTEPRGNDIKLYAIWEADGTATEPAEPSSETHKATFVDFDINFWHSMSVTNGSRYGELPAIAWEDWVFLGWFTEPEGGTQITPDTIVSLTEDRFIYAHWKKNVGASSSVSFTDVPSGAWYADAVNWAIAKGITNGTGTNTFSPEAQCTNDQIITFLYRAAGSPAVSGVTLPFAVRNAWAGDALKWAYSRNVIDNGFDEEAPCTRYAAVGCIWKAFGCPAAQGGTNFSDIAGLDARPIAWAVGKGIVNGTSATTFSPDLTCDRGTIVTLLHRAYK